LQKDRKSQGEYNLNSELYKHPGSSVHDRLLLFNNIYTMGEMPDEWKNSIVIPVYKKGDKQKGDEQKVEHYRGW
jgi:hypothetical protein